MARRANSVGPARRLADRLLRHDHEPCLRCRVTDVFWKVEPLRRRQVRRRLLVKPVVVLLQPVVVLLVWVRIGWARAVFGTFRPVDGRPS